MPAVPNVLQRNHGFKKPYLRSIVSFLERCTLRMTFLDLTREAISQSGALRHIKTTTQRTHTSESKTHACWVFVRAVLRPPKARSSRASCSRKPTKCCNEAFKETEFDGFPCHNRDKSKRLMSPDLKIDKIKYDKSPPASSGNAEHPKKRLISRNVLGACLLVNFRNSKYRHLKIARTRGFV